MTVNIAMTNNICIDFVWSTQKGRSSLFPLYKMALSQGWDSNLYKVKKQSFLKAIHKACNKEGVSAKTVLRIVSWVR